MSSKRWDGHVRKQLVEDSFVASLSGRPPELWLRFPVPEGALGHWERGQSTMNCVVVIDAGGETAAAHLSGPSVEAAKVDLTSIPVYFGGRRWYWLCPGCRRRVACLYLPPGSRDLRCRHCHDLTYRCSQQHDRTLDRFYHMTRAELEAATRSEDARTREKAQRVLQARLRVLPDGFELFY